MRTIVISTVVSVLVTTLFLIAGIRMYGAEVPGLEQLTLEAAQVKADASDLTTFVVRESPSPTVEKGRVLSQAPLPGARVLKGEVVLLTLSSGPAMEAKKPPVETVKVPPVQNLSFNDARTALTEAGLKLGHVSSERTEEKVASGTVLRSVPQPGASVDEGSAVALVLAMGQRSAKVPKVTFRGLNTARKVLEDAGFAVKVRRVSSEDHAFGVVIRQLPSAGDEVPHGTEVTVTVNVEAAYEE